MHDGRGATATTREVRRALDGGGLRYLAGGDRAVTRASMKQQGANAGLCEASRREEAVNTNKLGREPRIRSITLV